MPVATTSSQQVVDDFASALRPWLALLKPRGRGYSGGHRGGILGGHRGHPDSRAAEDGAQYRPVDPVQRERRSWGNETQLQAKETCPLDRHDDEHQPQPHAAREHNPIEPMWKARFGIDPGVQRTPQDDAHKEVHEPTDRKGLVAQHLRQHGYRAELWKYPECLFQGNHERKYDRGDEAGAETATDQNPLTLHGKSSNSRHACA